MNPLPAGSAAAAGEVAAQLAELARRWPVGLRVRHTDSGWLGTVTADAPGQAPGITVGDEPAAHCLLFAPPYGQNVPAVVCVAWDRAGAAEVAWMRTEWLQPAPDPAPHVRPAERPHLRRRARGRPARAGGVVS